CPPTPTPPAREPESAPTTVLPITTTDLRLFLHVLAATVWVGGQVVVAGLVPVLRGISTEAPRLAARRFAAVAWPAFAVVVATGVWNLLEVPLADTGRRYRTTLVVKLALVAVSGIAAFVHARARRPVALAAWGAVSLATALGALFLGIVLRG
ncbi:MAG: hypothetical protein ACT452_17735, partial [Microthrixaceae bacterium]